MFCGLRLFCCFSGGSFKVEGTLEFKGHFKRFKEGTKERQLLGNLRSTTATVDENATSKYNLALS